MLLVVLDERHAHAHGQQELGQIVGDAAADEKGRVDLRQVPAQGPQVGGEVSGGAGDIELVPGLGDEVTVGDDDLPLALAGGEEDVWAVVAEQLRQGLAHDGVCLPDADAQHLHLAPEEGIHVGRRGEAEQAGNF